MRKHLLAFATMILATPAVAHGAPTIDPVFGDHAVIQRDQRIRVTGTAAPGETLTVTLGNRKATARAGADGRFAAEFAPMGAGGPFTLTVEGPAGSASATDLLAGDVFLCSGQSNMELQVKFAQAAYVIAGSAPDEKLRLMTIEKVTAATPRSRFAHAPAWVVAGPATVPDFSAACFYMAQELRKSSGVPIGAIASSWGGTQISTWMGDDAQRAIGRGDVVTLLSLYGRDPAAAARQAGGAWEAWWRQRTGDLPGKEPWQPDAPLDWRSVPMMDVWEHWGVPELAHYDGMVWFQRRVTLTAEQARQGATLGLGPVDDMDRTWVNGIASGAGGNPGAPRNYPLAPGTLHAGVNVVTVNAHDVYADGGMRGPADLYKLTLADGSTIALGDDWVYALEHRTQFGAPRVPWDDVAGAGLIYNAMIAPFGRLGLKGIAWYQGEADTDIPGYADRLSAMMADWRRQFGQPSLPFAIVQLTGFGTPATQPGKSGWADVRESQRRAVSHDDHAALAVIIDLGDPLDIHPGEKHEVGRRLALGMQIIAYGQKGLASGPAIAAANAAADGGVELRFSGVTGVLRARSSVRAIGFELCGPADGDCRYAPGVPSGDHVTITGDGRPVTRVRYAWADFPAVNLFDDAQLPVGPFEIPVGKQ